MKNLVNYLNDYFDENEEVRLTERKFNNRIEKIKTRKMLNEDMNTKKKNKTK